MIENLLHAKIIFSKKNIEALRAKEIANVPSAIGVVTFLGSADSEGKMLHLLFRFNSVGCDTLNAIHVTEAVLGRRVTAIYGNESVNSAPRLMATALLNRRLKSPSAYLCALGKEVADEWTRRILENKGAKTLGYY